MAPSAGGPWAAIALTRDQTRGLVQLLCCGTPISQRVRGGHVWRAHGGSKFIGRNHSGQGRRGRCRLSVYPHAPTRDYWRRRRGRRRQQQTGFHRRAAGGRRRCDSSSHGASGAHGLAVTCRALSSQPHAWRQRSAIWAARRCGRRLCRTSSVCMLLAGRVLCRLEHGRGGSTAAQQPWRRVLPHRAVNITTTHAAMSLHAAAY
jgi:hypothetical protein